MDRNNSKKIKSVNIVSAHRTNIQFDDLGYYEYNELENLDIAPRSKVKVKANIIRRNNMDKFPSDDYLCEIYKGSSFFENGIYVHYDNAKGIDKNLIHPCGWDFISFKNVNEEYPNYIIYDYIFRIEDISNGVYYPHQLEEILEIVGKDGWSFDKNNEWRVTGE